MKLVLKILLGLTILLSVGGIGWWVWRAEHLGVFNILITSEKKSVPDLDRYEVLVDELERWREDLSSEYKNAKTAEERAEVERDARVILELVLPEMMRCWKGTEYDFDGFAEKPGSGKIACGYFVSTVIRDAGFKVNRFKLAQQPSENILRTFIKSENCFLRVGQDFEKYADWVEGKQPGVYLIGLDTHVGFIVNQADGMKLLHSSATHSVGVVEESRDSAAALHHSKWRMLGSLTGDLGFIRTWLGGNKVRVVQ